MKRFFSIIGAVVIVCFSFFFSACKETEIVREQILLEFSQYEADPNVMIVHNGITFYFANHEFRAEDLDIGYFGRGYVVKHNEIYLGAWGSDEAGGVLLVYKTDFYGNSLELVFKKSGYKNIIDIDGVGDYIYFTTKEKISWSKTRKSVNSYNVKTGIFTEIESGINISTPDYCQTRFSPAENTFEIEDPETGEKYRIDETTLQKSETYSSMQKFKYEPYRCEISNGHILVAYSIGSKESWGYSGICVIYEYNSERDSLEYKAVILPCDAETSDFVYAE